MVKINDVNQDALVQQVALDLEKEGKIVTPDWTIFVKTGSNKERPPLQDNWWFLRTASILRKVAVSGPIGVSKLRTKYGSKKNRGVRPERFVKSGGKIIRSALQQLEKAGYVVNEQKTKFKGRKITPAGMSLLDKSAGAIFTKVKTTESKKEETKPAEPKATEAKPVDKKVEAKFEEVKEPEAKKSEAKKPEAKEDVKEETKEQVE